MNESEVEEPSNDVCDGALNDTSNNKFYEEWIFGQLRFAKLCSRIMFTSTSSGTHSTGERLENAAKLQLKSLEQWRLSLPDKYRDIHSAGAHIRDSDSKKLWLFCQYHTAVFASHGIRGTRPESILRALKPRKLVDNCVTTTSEDPHEGYDPCLFSAQVILTSAALLSRGTVLSNR